MAYKFYTKLANSRNYGKSRSTSSIKYLLYHYTGNSTDKAASNANYFANNIVKASAHYFVDETNVYQSVPDNYVAWAVGGRKYPDCSSTGGGKMHGIITNSNSISIEMCSTNGAISEETLINAVALGKLIMSKYGIKISNVYRHFDVTGKQCPGWKGWIDSNPYNWNKLKSMLNSSFSGLANSAASDGNWYYYKNGNIASSFCGLAQNNHGWFYIRNGKVDFSFSGLVQNDQGWWYVDKGYIDFKHNGLFYDDRYGWWYIQKSKIDKQHTGLVENSKGWWFVDKGKIDFKHNGLYHDAEHGWWYVKDSKIDKSYTNLVKYNNDWWYVQNGHITFSFNGIVKNQYGTWYVSKSKVDFSFCGHVKYNGQTYNVVKGKIK